MGKSKVPMTKSTQWYVPAYFQECSFKNVSALYFHLNKGVVLLRGTEAGLTA